MPEGGPAVAGAWLLALAWPFALAVAVPEGGPAVAGACEAPEVLGAVEGGVTPVQYCATVSPFAFAAADRFWNATEWLAACEPLEAA